MASRLIHVAAGRDAAADLAPYGAGTASPLRERTLASRGPEDSPRFRAARRAALLRERESRRYGLRRLRPAVSLSCTLALAAAALVTTNPAQSAVILVIVVTTLAASRVLRAAWPYIRVSLYIVAIVLLVNPLFAGAGLDVLWGTGVGPFRIAVTVQGVVFGVGSALRLAGVILAFSLLNLCVDPDDQLAIASRFSFRSGLVLSLAARLLPVFSRDAARIIDAQRARGVRLDDGRANHRAALRLPLLATLLTQSLERAVDVAASMEARGYGAGRRTRWARRRRWTPTDAAALSAAVTAFAGVVVGAVAGAWSFTYFPLLGDIWSPLGGTLWLVVVAGLVIPLIVTMPWRPLPSSSR